MREDSHRETRKKILGFQDLEEGWGGQYGGPSFGWEIVSRAFKVCDDLSRVLPYSFAAPGYDGSIVVEAYVRNGPGGPEIEVHVDPDLSIHAVWQLDDDAAVEEEDNISFDRMMEIARQLVES